MTMYGFTAGPWTYRVIGDCRFRRPESDDLMLLNTDGSCLGVLWTMGDGDQEAEKCARILAAAPDLFLQHQWNKTIRDNVDELLAQAGFIPDSSVRHQLALMNFDGLASATGSRG